MFQCREIIILFIYLFILLRLGVTYIKTMKTITKPGRDTTTVRTKSCARLEVSSGPGECLIFTEPSRKNRQRRQHFPAAKPKQLVRQPSGKICADV